MIRSSFSPEQVAVIDSWGRGMAVLAGAGSGKTTTLVGKCLRLLELKPGARFAAVSFTERSAGDLRSRLSAGLAGLGDPSALGQHWVMTIHGLCGAVLREFPSEAGFDGEETVLKESEALVLWHRALDTLWYDEIPPNIDADLELLLRRESRASLVSLFLRVKEIVSFGVLDSLGASRDPESLALIRVSRFVLEKYQGLKQRQGVLDFSDLEMGADRALQHPRVREAYHKRFDLLVIDEFQDTNPVQARILWRLARPDFSNLCVVGDPKQSIYRFRDADVSVFEEYCNQMPVRLSLDSNFRSRPGIIHTVNHVCGSLFGASSYEALIPRRPKACASEVVRLIIESPADLGNWILAQVDKGIPLHDMALLLRRIRGSEKWLKALSGCGISIAVGSGGLFWEDPRVRELVAFLRWWDCPENSMSGAVFLRSPWMRISDEVLDAWSKEDRTWSKPFFESRHPIAEVLKEFRTKPVRPGELLLQILNFPGVDEELGAPILGLWHRVEELSSAGMDFHAVVAELSTALDEKRRERDVPAPRNLGQLTVLTLHGAKGLEFPHVILADFEQKPKSSDNPLLYWDRVQGAYLAKRDANGQRERNSVAENPWKKLEKEKNLAESKRLFYVALTRAKERLVLVCPPLEYSVENLAEAFQHDCWRDWIEVTADGSWTLENGPDFRPSRRLQVDSAEDLSLPANQKMPQMALFQGKVPLSRARHSVTEWTLLSRCPRAYEWKYIRPREPGDLKNSENETEDSESFQEIGSKVHASLEARNWDELANWIEPSVVQWLQNSRWMELPEPKNGVEVFSELNFEIIFENEVLVGTLDRLIVQNKTRATLVDFKFSPGPRSNQSILSAYQTQMELYAHAVTRLEPRLSLENIFGALVLVTPNQARSISVPWGKVDLPGLVKQARMIIRGEAGVPRPGKNCRFCDFQKICPEGVIESEKLNEKTAASVGEV